MKKLFILSVFAVGLMTSCSEDEYMPISSLDTNTIAFATNSAKGATRSGSTLTSISKFTVSAVNNDKTSYFSNVLFNYNAGSAVFTSQTPYYWPVGGTLNFYAISDPGTVSVDAYNAPVYSYENWGGETDLVAATALAGEKRIPYPLTFQHVLSQISVGAEAADKTEVLTYKLVGVDMTTPANGTYSFANATAGFGTWAIDNSAEKTYSYADALPKSFANTSCVNSGSTYWNILPVADGKIKFNVAYQVFQNGKMIADFTGANAKTCEVQNPNLLSGKRYVYNFLLTRGSDDSITFTLDLKDWEDGSTTDITLGGGNSIPSVDDTPTMAAVDMGLSVKWSSMNLGATKTGEKGRYYYWGGTTGYTYDEIHGGLPDGMSIFLASTYDSSPAALIDSNLSRTNGNDAANVALGESWRIPTKTEFDELLDLSNCSRELKEYDGIEGIEFTSLINGNKIFLPYCGAANSGVFSWLNSGYYWTSTYNSSEKCYMFHISLNSCSTLLYNRYFGENIRPVCD